MKNVFPRKKKENKNGSDETRLVKISCFRVFSLWNKRNRQEIAKNLKYIGTNFKKVRCVDTIAIRKITTPSNFGKQSFDYTSLVRYTLRRNKQKK